MMTTFIALLLLVSSTQAFFFGNSAAGCGCAPPPPACPPPSPCGAALPPIPPVSCGGGCGASAPSYVLPPLVSGYAAPSYGGAAPSYAGAPQPSYAGASQPSYVNDNSQYLPPSASAQAVQTQVQQDSTFQSSVVDTSAKRSDGNARVKRNDELAFDPKCNSEPLKKIILENISDNTATSKRQIQSAAATQLGGRVDVICSKGTFSYIVNTEIYCETEKAGITCFVFKQSS